MALETIKTLEIIEAMENFIDKRRPPENIRHKVDLSYKIEDQSIIIYEIRPIFNRPLEIIECGIAKATFVKTKNQWKIFWMRSDLKWHSYPPKPFTESVRSFINIVDKDENHCFWG